MEINFYSLIPTIVAIISVIVVIIGNRDKKNKEHLDSYIDLLERLGKAENNIILIEEKLKLEKDNTNILLQQIDGKLNTIQKEINEP